MACRASKYSTAPPHSWGKKKPNPGWPPTDLSTRYFRSPQTSPLATVFTLGVRMAWDTWKEPCLARSLSVVSRN